MKIYLNNYDFTDVDKSLNYDNEYYNDLFYTPEYFLIRENDDILWKSEIINDSYETHKIEDIVIYFDHSVLNKLERSYHIPKEHFHIIEHIHEKEITQDLFFIKKILYDQCNYYFEYNGNKESFSFKELFNFINYK